MANLTALIAALKTASKGEDVRDAIADTLSAVNVDNIAIEEHLDELEPKINDIDENVSSTSASASTATTKASQAAASATAAAGSAATASTKAGEAAASASAASTSAGTATTKAGEASASATAASGSAATATTKAGEAASSAASASGSASTAADESTAAAGSAAAASASADNASDSEVIATTQAGIATTKATEAGAAKTAAETAQGIAVQAKDDAVTAKNAAELAENHAETAEANSTASELAAAASALAASGSEATATTKAGESAASAAAALASEQAAETAKDQTQAIKDAAVLAMTDTTNSTEVIAARKGQVSLGAKIDSIDSQLADISTQIDATEQGESINLDGGIRLGQRKKQAIITFTSDDGAVADYTKLKPAFEVQGMPVTMGIITSKMNTGGYLTTAQLQELEGLGWEVASHTHGHISMSSLSTEAEIEAELSQSKAELNALGFKAPNIIYPFGGHDERVRRLARKYYRSGLKVGGGLNSTPLHTYAITRVAVGSYFDPQKAAYPYNTNTLEYYKWRVDEAVANNMYLVLMMHPGYADHDATQQQHVIDLLAYIKSLNVLTLTLNDALDKIGNLVDVGDYTGGTETDEGDYFAVDCQGNAISKAISNTLPIVFDDSKLSTDLIATYKVGKITYTKITSGNASTFPEGLPGLLITDYAILEAGYQRQKYVIFNTDKVYERYTKTNGSWSTSWLEYVKGAAAFTATINIGTIAANSTVDITINTSLVSPKDFILISPITDLESGLIIMPYTVSTYSYIKIRVANITTAAITSGNKDMYIKVIREH